MKCEDCKWWESGVCHKYPPKVVVITSSNGNFLESNTDWPATSKTDWCGEFKERN